MYWYHALLYILLIIVIISLIFAAYIKYKFQFWTMQPVFHVYDLKYFFFGKGIIMQKLPEKNKYCNFKNIETLTYGKNLSDPQINKFINFIIGNFLQNKENKFMPKKDNITPYFEGHNHPSYFSFYNEDELIMDQKKGTLIEDKRIKSVMTGRPIHVKINKTSTSSKNGFFDAYYIDYLCVDKNSRKSGIAPQVIQTHEYNARHLNKNIQVSIFKREGELTGIVPLCIYNTYGFPMDGWIQPTDLPANYSLIECGPNNLHHLLDFMKREDMSNNFDIIMTTETSNLLELIKTKNIYIYFIIQEDEVQCVYFYRKTNTYIEEGIEGLCCFASIKSSDFENELFVHGYKVALWKICVDSKTLRFAVVEDISHNNAIIENLKKRTIPSIICPCAYFFYNFAYSTFHCSKVLIVN
jgi:hypothetical protein